MVTRNESRPCFFPDSIERIPLCAADKSIPAVESVAGDERAALELDRLSRLVESQADLERELDTASRSDQSYHLELECNPPEPCTEFQTARLILSHLGFLSLPALKAAVDSPVPRLVVLDNDSARFVQDLESLDRLSSRTHDTILVYYVRAGQTRSDHILANSSSGDLSPLYLEVLGSLGWPVSVSAHPGWTGDVTTSWRPAETSDQTEAAPGPARYSGEKALLYWADVCGELAILVPSTSTQLGEVRPSSAQGAAFLMSGPDSGGYEETRPAAAPSSLSLELEQDQAARRKVGRGQGQGGAGDQRVVLAWLESIEDADNFPLGDLVTSVNNICLVIFVHPLANGLLRIKLAGQIGK